MNTRYQTAEIPTFAHGAAPEAFEAMVNGGLPAFVLRLSAVELNTTNDLGVPDIPRLYSAVLAKHDFAVTEYETLAEDRAQQGFPLHFDYEPEPDSHIVDKLNFHFTQTGVAEASFFEPKDAFWKEGFLDVTEDQDEDFDRGRVDDTYFNPLRHRALLEPSTLLVFRLQGLVPLVHKFKTQQLDRKSHIWMAERQSHL
jgi:hypothetical protein